MAHFKIGKIPYEDWALPIYVACRDRANRCLRPLESFCIGLPFPAADLEWPAISGRHWLEERAELPFPVPGPVLGW